MEQKIMEDIIELIDGLEWLYNFPVTQIFTRDVLSKMPEDWKISLRNLPNHVLNGIAHFEIQDNWPDSLQNFLVKCRELSLGGLASHDRQDNNGLATLHSKESDGSVTDHFEENHELVSCNEIQQKYTQGLSDACSEIQQKYTQGLSDTCSEIQQKYTQGLSEKKQHEVTHLVKLIQRISTINGITHILDIGCGLGYIDTLLHQLLKLTVVGVDSKETFIQRASARQTKLSGQCKCIKHIHWTLSDDLETLEKAQKIVKDLTSANTVCTCIDEVQREEKPCRDVPREHLRKSFLTDEEGTKSNKPGNYEGYQTSTAVLGLHSCADLSPVMMKIFCSCPQISTLILLSCCYHKMCLQKQSMNDLSETLRIDCMDIRNSQAKSSVQSLNSRKNNDRFENFPMSNALRAILKEKKVDLSVYALRLAAQESGLRWTDHSEEDHSMHVKNVAYRALLETYCEREGVMLKKLRRRCARKSSFTDFNEYITTVLRNYEFSPTPDTTTPNTSKMDKEDKERQTAAGETRQKYKTEIEVDRGEVLFKALQEHYAMYEHLFELIEPFTGLQLALQPVLEALVLVDRVTFLKELGYSQVWLEKVFNPVISPRNVALIALR